MSQLFRLPKGGCINRARPLTFSVDGQSLRGFEGDSLASALLANGQSVLSRSFKYHRPRGIMTAGVEEPNALLTLGAGALAVPNVRATLVPLQDGQVVRTQNAWPSVRYDVGEINDLFSPLLGAGFYYKTFMAGGPYMWRAFEYFIRRAAGLGVASQMPYDVPFEKVNAYCDVLIVGGGAAGLSAALSAGRAGARVVLVDEGLAPGSHLVGNRQIGINGIDADAWVRASVAELESLGNVRLLPKTTAFGLYDGQVAGLVQRLDPSDPRDLSERYWVLRAKKIVLATGAIERPLVFAGNDRPGVMLAGALGTYARQFAVAAGHHPLLFTNNDTAYALAQELMSYGIRDITIADSRREVKADLISAARDRGIGVYLGHGIAKTHGRLGVTGASLVELRTGHRRTVNCDVIGLSGGWSPTIHLASHRGTKPQWSQAHAAFMAGQPTPGADWTLTGAVQGGQSLQRTLMHGGQAGATAAKALGFDAPSSALARIEGDQDPGAQSLFFAMPAAYLRRRKAFVDFQHDVLAKDVKQAVQEGFLSPEHMKRYTTLGMATDQGKLSNSLGQALLAQAQGRSITEVGTTTYRPPYTPVTLGAFAEANSAEKWIPERRSPLRDWHVANGGTLIESADWRRAWFYPKGIEDLTYASRREAFHVRQHVGLSDVSTLGKIEVQGPDAAQLLDLVYANRMSTLKVGKSRYGLILREDGIVLDDGTASRLGEDHFFITTTTLEAPHVMAHMEHLVQVEFPELEVHLTSVTDLWASLALAGPKSRSVLANLLGADQVSNEALPYMGFVEAEAAGVPIRIHRISFSGELAYEIYAPARAGITVWQALLAAGQKQQIDVYGLEALDLLRIEKGFPTGNEIDGRTTARMLGLAGMLKDSKDYIGRRLKDRQAMTAAKVPTLVGLRPLVPDQPLRGGGQLVREEAPQDVHDALGYVSSAGYSTTLGMYVGLGFLRGGLDAWEGKSLFVADPVRGQHFEVRVVQPSHVDPAGERVRG